MALISIDGKILRKMFIMGANEVTRNTQSLNALNVFPVPDGDTGTNMSHTVQAAARAAMESSSPNVCDVAKAASSGALRGARGNSGVILSQLFRGFAKGLEGKSTANAEVLAEAFSKASEMAYKAVMKPKEGTMLTIARAAAEASHEAGFDALDIDKCLELIIKRSDEMLQKTPDMLPVLKQAGVVDSGGMGIVCFFQGLRDGLWGKGEVELLGPQSDTDVMPTAGAHVHTEIKFGYCTEFLVELAKPDHRKIGQAVDAEGALKAYLPTIGDSAVVIGDEGLIKVHVHTDNPGKALEKGLQFGSLHSIKIDNMREQHNEIMDFSQSNEPPKPVGIVAVAAGQGMSELFYGLGVDYVIEGGQSMNPSADDIAKAILKVNAESIIVLPNNKNIILTAEQAGILAKDKKVYVLPTRSMPQGVSCVVANTDTITLEENLEGMKAAMDAVHSGQITIAVRDTILDGHNIKENDFLCIYDGDIALVEKDKQAAAKAMVDYMLKDGGDIVSVYYGEDTNIDQASEIEAYIAEKYPLSEVEVYHGKQPLYHYIISVE